jgi:F-type H+-transporting ATPase subunit delta
MADKTLVRAYVRAAFETATDPWANALQAIVARLEKRGDIPALDNASTPFEKKQELLNAAFPAQTPEAVRNFVLTLASKNHTALLRDIVAAFDNLVAQDTDRDLATVTTAVALTENESARLETKLRAQYGERIRIEYQLDPDIIGGVIVRFGDRVLDGSVAGKLAALKNNLESVK